MNESTIRGVSVRALIALVTVCSGLAFLYVVGILFSGVDGVLLTVITTVATFVGTSIGYYLGQRQPQTPEPPVS